MATRGLARRTSTRPPRLTAPEAILGPLAGALVGFAFFALVAAALGALIGTGEFALPNQNWETLGYGASIAAGVVLFVGFAYGGFVAGRLGGTGQRGHVQGLMTFLAGLVLALLAGWAVQAGADGEQAQQYAQSLRALGVPGDLGGWGDVATTAGISALLGMLLGSLAGGALAHRKAEVAVQEEVATHERV